LRVVEYHYGPMLVYASLVTGFIWVSMVTGYVEGFRLHAQYIRRNVSMPRYILHGVVGALVDVVSPWYALVTRPSRGDFISKERPVPSAG
jgi:hypothetical protein